MGYVNIDSCQLGAHVLMVGGEVMILPQTPIFISVSVDRYYIQMSIKTSHNSSGGVPWG